MDNLELFPTEDTSQQSPKMAWMRKHNIRTKYRDDLPASMLHKWEAYYGDYAAAVRNTVDDCANEELSLTLAMHSTESAALENLALNRGLPMWHSEPL